MVTFIDLASIIFNVLIFLRVILSWFSKPESSRFHKFVYDLTEPLLGPIRKLVPMGGVIDVSPIIAYIILQLLSTGAHMLLGKLV